MVRQMEKETSNRKTLDSIECVGKIENNVDL
jgi:hypothetical protein